MPDISRRTFLKQSFNSIVSYALLEMLFSNRMFSRSISPLTDHWAKSLNEYCLDLQKSAITLTEWQTLVETLLQRVELKELMKFIDFERLSKNFDFPDLGTKTKPIIFPRLDGLPESYAFYRKLFGLKKGRAIIPHGHKNMVSAHLVLNGEFELRHYDKVRDEGEHLIIEPTIDEIAGVGSASSISDDKNNIHWFITRSDFAFTFDLIMVNIDPAFEKTYDIENIDPENGEKISGGLLRVRKMDVEEALKKYGKEMHHH